MKKQIIKGTECLNCHQELNDENFCPECGQLNNTAKPTFYHLVLEALSNLFAFDSKFYVSIWRLISKPGILTLENVNGKRTSFLPPIRLFLLVTIIMLALFSITDRFSRPWDDVEHLRTESVSPLIRTASDTVNKESSVITFSNDSEGKLAENMFKYIQEHPTENATEGLKNMKVEDTFFNRLIYVSILKLNSMTGRTYSQFIMSNIIIILLLFVPILALVLKLMYFTKRQYYYVDHFVFALHLLTAAFVAIIISYLFMLLLSDWLMLAFVLGFLFYFYKALKNFYQQKTSITVFKFIVINISFVFISFIFILLVAVVSFILV